MLGALVAGGVSLLSGLFGRSSAKKQAKKEEDAIRKANDVATAQAEQMNREIRARADAAALVPVATSRETASRTESGVDMKAFMSAAEENGFNPLTFLRSGALSLFANTTTSTEDWTCTTGERAMDAALSGTYLPSLQPVISSTKVPGVGDVFGNALTAGANQYLSDLSQQQNNDFQMALMERQLAGAQQRGAFSGPRSMTTPQAFLSGGTKKTTGPQMGGAQPGFVEIWDNRKGSPTYGQKMWVNNGEVFSDAEGLALIPMFGANSALPNRNAPGYNVEIIDQMEQQAIDTALRYIRQAQEAWGTKLFMDPQGNEVRGTN